MKGNITHPVDKFGYAIQIGDRVCWDRVTDTGLVVSVSHDFIQAMWYEDDCLLTHTSGACRLCVIRMGSPEYTLLRLKS